MIAFDVFAGRGRRCVHCSRIAKRRLQLLPLHLMYVVGQGTVIRTTTTTVIASTTGIINVIGVELNMILLLLLDLETRFRLKLLDHRHASFDLLDRLVQYLDHRGRVHGEHVVAAAAAAAGRPAASCYGSCVDVIGDTRHCVRASLAEHVVVALLWLRVAGHVELRQLFLHVLEELGEREERTLDHRVQWVE